MKCHQIISDFIYKCNSDKNSNRMLEKLKLILKFIWLGTFLRTRKETHPTTCHGFRSSMVRAQEPTKRPLWLMNTYDKGDVPNPWGRHMLFRDNMGKIEKKL